MTCIAVNLKGIVSKTNPDEEDWVGYAPARRQVDRVKEFLAKYYTASVSAKEYSYSLKHRVEEWTWLLGIRQYIGNGAAIQAALELGFRIQPYRSPQGLNADIFIKRRREMFHRPRFSGAIPEPII